MKAIGLTHYLPVDHPDALLDLELDMPVPTGRDLLVKIEAISVNPLDTKMRAPRPKVESRPRVLGWDAAGTVVGTGADASLFHTGDAVFYAGSIVRQGSNAQYHLVDERLVGHMPASIGFAEAAALPLTSITAWESLFERLRCSPTGQDRNDTILIIGGAGGVGSMAIQLAKALTGARVIATASRSESRAWCLALGADHVIDHAGDMALQLQDLGIGAIQKILCLNDIDTHFPAMAALIAPEGSICSVVDNKAPLKIEALKDKSVTFAWESMFTRSRFGGAAMIAQHDLLEQVARCIDNGSIRSTMTSNLGSITAANVRQAHARIESGRSIGKIVLAGFSGTGHGTPG